MVFGFFKIRFAMKKQLFFLLILGCIFKLDAAGRGRGLNQRLSCSGVVAGASFGAGSASQRALPDGSLFEPRRRSCLMGSDLRRSYAVVPAGVDLNVLALEQLMRDFGSLAEEHVSQSEHKIK